MIHAIDPVEMSKKLNWTDSDTFVVDRADGPALRSAFLNIARIGFCETRVCDRLGLSDLAQLLWRAIPIYREEQLAVRDALASSIDLFLLQGEISLDELNQLFDQADQEILVRAGLLQIDEKGLARAGASLFPVGECLICSDHAWPMLPHPGCVNVPFDQVMHVGPDSRWLARATVRQPAGAALDLCTGSGVQALLAASHSQRVLAVDINPRAVRRARFNVQASGATNIEVVVGDLYEPVGGEFFDLITANPPFVPSPENSLQFRDGGRSGEDVQRRIIAGLPHHLAPRGIAQMVTVFGEGSEDLLADRLREWLGGAPMDIHILRLQEESAPNYAMEHADGNDTVHAFLKSVRVWADNLKTQGYARIVSALLAFQWSDPTLGSPWTRIENSQPPHSNAGTEVEAAFLAERMVRKCNFHDMLERGRVSWAGPIGLIEARVLGSELRANAQAQLLGKALTILQRLDPVEREVLVAIEKSPAVVELLAMARGFNLDKEAVFSALGSLIRRGLVLLTSADDFPSGGTPIA